jgi:hypothetical protein
MQVRREVIQVSMLRTAELNSFFMAVDEAIYQAISARMLNMSAR